MSVQNNNKTRNTGDSRYPPVAKAMGDNKDNEKQKKLKTSEKKQITKQPKGRYDARKDKSKQKPVPAKKAQPQVDTTPQKKETRPVVIHDPIPTDFVNRLSRNSQLYQTPAEKRALLDAIPTNAMDINCGMVAPKRGWSVTTDGWVPNTTVPLKEMPVSEHPHILVVDGMVPVPTLFKNTPIPQYKTERELNDKELFELTRHLADDTDTARLCYAIRNWFTVEPTRTALSIMMLPWVHKPTREDVIEIIQNMPLSVEAYQDFLNLGSLIINHFLKGAPIGLKTNLTPSNFTCGFIVGSDSSHVYKRTPNPHLDKEFLAQTVQSHPRMMRAVDQMFSQYIETPSIYVEFDEQGKPTKESQRELDWARVAWRDKTKDQIIKAVAERNRMITTRNKRGAEQAIREAVVDDAMAEVKRFRPHKKKDEPIEIVGVCSTKEGEEATLPVKKSINLNALAERRTIPKGYNLFYSSGNKGKTNDFETYYSTLKKYPSSVRTWSVPQGNGAFASALLRPPLGHDDEQRQWWSTAAASFKETDVLFPSDPAYFAINIEVENPDEFFLMLEACNGDGVSLVQYQYNPGKPNPYQVVLEMPNVKDPTTQAFFRPQYYQPPFVPDKVFARFLFDNAKQDKAASTAKKVVDRFRKCAGCPYGQLTRYGKEITVNKNIPYDPPDVDWMYRFQAPELDPHSLSIQMLKDVWLQGRVGVTTSASSGLLYKDQKKSMLTVLADIITISQVSDKSFKFDYQPWMGAHEFKPKYENTDMDKFATKTRSIFVGNSFVQTIMTPLFHGLYAFEFDYDDPVSLIGKINSRGHCLGVTQQSFIKAMNNTTEEDRDTIREENGEHVWFAYSDNVYYFNTVTGEFRSLDGVAMESQVREEHIDIAFDLLTIHEKELGRKVILQPGTKVGSYRNPSYNPEARVHDNPQDYHLQPLELVMEIFKDVEVFQIKQEDKLVVWEYDRPQNHESLENVKSFFKKVFNGTVHSCEYQAPLGFLPSGWYITSLLNTIVSIEFIEKAKAMISSGQVSVRDVLDDPRVISGYNFTIENGESANIYSPTGFQALDFLGFNMNDGVAIVRATGLWPSVCNFSTQYGRASFSRKLAQTFSVWVSAMFNGGVSDPLFMEAFGYEIAMRLGARGTITLESTDFDADLYGLIQSFVGDNASLSDLVKAAADFCGMKNPPPTPQDRAITFRTPSDDEISFVDTYGKDSLGVAVQLFLAGRVPYTPVIEITTNNIERLALRQILELSTQISAVAPGFLNQWVQTPEILFDEDDDDETARYELLRTTVLTPKYIKQMRSTLKDSLKVAD